MSVHKIEYLVTNSKNWFDIIEADRITKDTCGNTLMFMGDDLVASFPSEFLVTIKKQEEVKNVTMTNIIGSDKVH